MTLLVLVKKKITLNKFLIKLILKIYFVKHSSINIIYYLQHYLKSLIPNIIINTIKLSKATCHIKIGWNKLALNKTNIKKNK